MIQILTNVLFKDHDTLDPYISLERHNDIRDEGSTADFSDFAVFI